MEKLYFMPQYPPGVSKNPYCENYMKSIKDLYDMVWRSDRSYPRGFEFFLNSFKADIYVVNWVENIYNLRGGIFQAILALIALSIIRLRGKKIVWMFHNITPHGGETFWSRILKKRLYMWSYAIIAHSKEAAEYARRFAHCTVFFKNHPVQVIDYGEWKDELCNCDFFYWSDIFPYKGVREFISNHECRKTDKTILLIGRCKDEKMRGAIESLVKKNIIYENRSADYREIAAYCRKAKYVVFPYVGDSVSSSGVLMDTLLMGGTPVGPNRGAFADLASQGCCITYDNIEEVFRLPIDEEHRLKLNPDNLRKFIEQNSWKSYGEWFYEKMKEV